MGIYNLAIHLGRGVSFGGGALLGNPHRGPSPSEAVQAALPPDAAALDAGVGGGGANFGAEDDGDDEAGGNWLGLGGALNPIERAIYTLPVDSLVDMTQLMDMGLTVLYVVGDQLVLTNNIADGGLSSTAAAAAAAVSVRRGIARAPPRTLSVAHLRSERHAN